MRDNAEALASFRDELADALAEGDQQAMLELAAEMIARFGAMPGRGPGLSSWSAYTAMQRVAPSELVDRLVQALMADGRLDDEARREAGRRMGGFTAMVEADARRRIAEEKGPEHVANVAIKPSIDRLDFTAARRSDLEQMRREIYPLARRLATRLTQEHHAKRRGPLDFRRTVRASMSTGGVPLTTHHKPKRPHRTELVVLCDVSGSVANFAQFTLLLVYALRDQFEKVRAFTFIDHVHEVTEHFVPGADPADVLTDLAASTAHAALWGRTNYGRALVKFEENHADALGPKSSLLILGDARSNYSDLHLDVLQAAGRSGPARLVAQPRAPAALGHRRLRGDEVRRGRADGRVPQPDPARGVRARHPVTVTRSRTIWNTWLVTCVAAVAVEEARSCSPARCSVTDGSVEASTAAAPAR